MNISSYLKNLAGLADDEDTKRKLDEYQRYYNQQMGLDGNSSDSLPELPSYDRLEYDEPSDEEIRKSAEAELADYAKSGERSIRDRYAEKESDLSAKREDDRTRFEDDSDKLKKAYDEAAETLGNDVLKRGLARSSIAVNKQAEVGKAYAEGMRDLISERNDRLQEIDAELSSLDEQLKNALDDFRISYAAKLTERMNELKSEREKNKADALKYNNSLAKEEYEQRLAREKSTSSSAKKMTEAEKSVAARNVYEKAEELLNSLPFEDAKELFLGDPIFRDTLSDYYYYKLYYKFR